MSAAPPSELAPRSTTSEPSAPVTEVMTAADGVVEGVAAATAELGPVPAAFTAATRKWYVVPLVSPLTVADVAVDTPSVTVVKGPTLEVARWIT